MALRRMYLYKLAIQYAHVVTEAFSRDEESVHVNHLVVRQIKCTKHTTTKWYILCFLSITKISLNPRFIAFSALKILIYKAKA